MFTMYFITSAEDTHERELLQNITRMMGYVCSEQKRVLDSKGMAVYVLVS